MSSSVEPDYWKQRKKTALEDVELLLLQVFQDAYKAGDNAHCERLHVALEEIRGLR